MLKLTNYAKEPSSNLSRGARHSEKDYAKEPSSQFVSGCKAKRKRLCQRTIITICLGVQGEAKTTMPKNHHHNLSRGARRSENDYAKEPSSNLSRGARRSEKDYAKEPSSQFCLGVQGEAKTTMPKNHHENVSVSLVRCLSM